MPLLIIALIIIFLQKTVIETHHNHFFHCNLIKLFAFAHEIGLPINCNEKREWKKEL